MSDLLTRLRLSRVGLALNALRGLPVCYRMRFRALADGSLRMSVIGGRDGIVKECEFIGPGGPATFGWER